MSDEQESLFDWLRNIGSPRGSVSRAGATSAVDDEAVRQLHARLQAALGTVDLVVTNNRRRMVTAKKRGRRHELRVHHMFVDCDDETLHGLVAMARGVGGGKDAVRAWIRANTERIAPRAVGDTAPTRPSENHDLLASLHRAAALVDEDVEDVRITWGQFRRGARSIRLGSFDFEQRLIRIHPALDADWVPSYFVDFVVYHELLHSLFPPGARRRGQRRVLHPPEFREREARFPRYEEAMRWERANLNRLLSR